MLIYRPDSNRPILNQIGSKAYGLAELQNSGLKIPKWFVLTSDCFLDFLYESRDEFFHLLTNYSEMNRRKIVKIILATKFSDEVKQKIRAEMANTFQPMDLVSVRSSATDEDRVKYSFEESTMNTYLNVRQDDGIFEYIKNCFASCFSESAMQYRYEHGLITPHIRIAVIIQEMIKSDYSGVIYTSNPQTNNPDEVFISVVSGEGDNLTSGRESTSDYTINAQCEIHHLNPQRKARLDTDSLYKIYDIALGIEKSHNPRVAQEIEFAKKDDSIYILQAQPIIEMQHLDKNKPRTILDASDLTEDFAGTTTPLTYTFTRDIYTKVYQHALTDLHVDPELLKQSKRSIENILAFYDNKIYQNLNNWYDVISLIPGKPYNQTQLATILNIEPSTLDEKQSKSRLRFLSKLLSVNGLSKKFINKFNRITRPYYNNTFAGYNSEQLLETYKDLESDIVQGFAIPVINNLGVKVTYYALLDLAKEANIYHAENLISDMLSRQVELESARQNDDLLKLVSEIRKEPTLYKLFKDSSVEELTRELQAESLIIFSKINNYINHYGIHFVEELKLESITLHQNPSILLSLIKQYIDLPQLPEHKAKNAHNSEQKFMSYFSGAKKIQAKLLIKQAKTFVRNRESLRLCYARYYAIVRNIYLRIGQNMTNERLIRSQRDIFYLEKDEIVAIVKRGRFTVDEIRNRIDERKQAHKINEQKNLHLQLCFYGEMKARNVIPIHHYQEIQTKTTKRLLRGTGCGNETVTGVVKFAHSIDDLHDLNDNILMLKYADAGWAMYFPMAKAVIVEQGNILSHFAVISRNANIPLIVNTRGLTYKIQDGDTVKVDSKNGTVEIIKRADGSEIN